MNEWKTKSRWELQMRVTVRDRTHSQTHNEHGTLVKVHICFLRWCIGSCEPLANWCAREENYSPVSATSCWLVSVPWKRRGVKRATGSRKRRTRSQWQSGQLKPQCAACVASFFCRGTERGTCFAQNFGCGVLTARCLAKCYWVLLKRLKSMCQRAQKKKHPRNLTICWARLCRWC